MCAPLSPGSGGPPEASVSRGLSDVQVAALMSTGAEIYSWGREHGPHHTERGGNHLHGARGYEGRGDNIHQARGQGDASDGRVMLMRPSTSVLHSTTDEPTMLSMLCHHIGVATKQQGRLDLMRGGVIRVKYECIALCFQRPWQEHSR